MLITLTELNKSHYILKLNILQTEKNIIHTVKVHIYLSEYLVSAGFVKPNSRCFVGSIQCQLHTTEAPERALLYKVLLRGFLFPRQQGKTSYFLFFWKIGLN